MAKSSVADALASQPLLIAPKTYNTNHPDYDATAVRNYPGRVFDRPGGGPAAGNPVYEELLAMSGPVAEAKPAPGPAPGASSSLTHWLGRLLFPARPKHPDAEVPAAAWTAVRQRCLEEIAGMREAKQVFARKAYIEDYVATLSRKHRAHYVPGWVNLDDAIFLYWVVRTLRPRVICQTGVCNGLSSAFMMLGLARNGPDGSLHVIDLPPIFDPDAPEWCTEGRVYGVVIPEGKTSGWMVPESYKNRFEVLNGDAKDLLPGLLDRLGTIDMFYHDSDHSYDHMIFEMEQAQARMRHPGVIVADDISWNASVWDFADENGFPAYNYQGTMGIIFS